MNRKIVVFFSFLTVGAASAFALAPAWADEGKACNGEHAHDRAAFHQKMLERFDTNHDGKLDDAERAAMRQARVDHIFGRLDRNNDGQLSADEVKGTRLEHRFASLDTDGSGTLSKQELLAAPRFGHKGEHTMRRVLRHRTARV